MTRLGARAGLLIAAGFFSGLGTYHLYLRWRPPGGQASHLPVSTTAHPVEFAPSASDAVKPDPPLLQARDLQTIRRFAGRRARVRGRIFRVGHSARSNTYFLDFGPSREALTGVIFAPAIELFEKKQMQPKSLEGREVEIEGEIRDHSQYGLEIILENPAQLKIID
ncbi:MAG TPA: hypothetical protein VNO43_14165 [Candidatus Eisenbacteria bacterium]|nr:hypothetical protein [Candidatus Eisenbacteria bacterium]